MTTGKEIIIVAGKEYSDVGRRLSHEISKLDGTSSAYWTISKYRDNEMKLKASQYVIFIGNQEENEFTKDYLPVIKNFKNKAGVCYGYDASKAVIFGEGNLDQKNEFTRLLKSMTTSSLGSAIAVSLVPILFPVSIIQLVSILLSASKEKKLKKEQTNAAIVLFMSEEFDNWIGNTK